MHLFIPECNIQKVDALKTSTELEDAKTATKTKNVRTTVKPAQFQPDLKNIRNVKIFEMKERKLFGRHSTPNPNSSTLLNLLC